MSQLRLESGT